MTSDRLFDVPELPPKLTDRQQRALDAIRAAGYDGLHTDELGAVAHEPKHAKEDRCEFCGQAGQEIGRALRAKGLVQQRRQKTPWGTPDVVWTVAGKLTRAAERDYGLPEGF